MVMKSPDLAITSISTITGNRFSIRPCCVTLWRSWLTGLSRLTKFWCSDIVRGSADQACKQGILEEGIHLSCLDSHRQINPGIRKPLQHLRLQPLVTTGQNRDTHSTEQQRKAEAHAFHAGQHPIPHPQEATA